MALGISCRERCLADAAQPMHRRNRDPSLVALERRIDRLERVVAAEEMLGDGDGDIADRDVLQGDSFGLVRQRVARDLRRVPRVQTL